MQEKKWWQKYNTREEEISAFREWYAQLDYVCKRIAARDEYFLTLHWTAHLKGVEEEHLQSYINVYHPDLKNCFLS